MLTAARHRPGAVVLALALAGGFFAAAGLSGAAQAQETLTPAQKAERLFHGYDRYGGKYSYDPVTEENGVLTVRNLKYAASVPWQDPKRPDSPKQTLSLKITVETVTARRYDYRNPKMPLFADVTYRGIRVDGSLFDRMGGSRFADIFGGDEMVLDVVQTHEADPAAGSIELKAGTVTIRKVFRFDLTGRFDGLDFARLTDPKLLEKLGPGSTASMPPDAAVATILDLLGEMRIHRLSYALTDLGGIGKMLAVMAAAQSAKNPDGPKVTAEMMRQGLAAGLAGAIVRFSGSFAPKMLGSTARWLLEPGMLTIALRPGRPLPVNGIVGFVGAFISKMRQAKGQKIDLDPLQKFLGLSVSYAPAAR